MAKKLLLALAITAVIGLFFALDVHRHFSLDSFRAQRESIDAYVSASPLRAAAGFFLVYVVVTGLSLPGAAVMTLIAGAVFGLVWGTAIVSFASSNKLLGTIHIYPTFVEANKYAAGAWKRNHVSPRVLSLLERYHAWTRA